MNQKQIKKFESKLISATDDEKLVHLDSLAFALRHSDTSRAQKYGSELLELAIKLNHPKSKSKAYRHLGAAHYLNGEYFETIKNFESSLKIERNLLNDEGVSAGLNNLAIIFSKIGNKQKSLNYYLNALDLFIKTGNVDGQAACTSNIGLLYSELNDFKNAKTYYKRALAQAEKHEYQYGIATTELNLGELLVQEDDYEEALKLFKNSLKKSQKQDSHMLTISILINISVAYSKQKKFDEALMYMTKAYRISDEYDHKEKKAVTLCSLSKIYTHLGKYSEALDHNTKANDLSNQLDSPNLKRQVFESFSIIYEKLVDFENALKYYKLFTELEKKYFGEKTKLEISQIHSNNKFEKIEEETRNLKVRHKEVTKSEKAYKKLFNDGSDAIYIQDNEGKFIDVNNRVIEMHGFAKEHFISKTFADLAAPGRNEIANLEMYFQKASAGEPQQFEFWSIRKNGAVFSIELRVSIGDYFGKEVLIIYARDITKRREIEKEKKILEARVVHTKKLESIGILASGVAHEINNPLTAVINYAELIMANETLSPRMNQWIDGILTGGYRVSEIVKNLLSFSKMELEVFEAIDIKILVKNAIDLVGSNLRDDEINFNFDASEGEASILCQKGQLQQVFMNILLNSQDSLNRKENDIGKFQKNIEISICPFNYNDVMMQRISIEDNGTGIDPQIHDIIYDPFFTTKSTNKGMGMGLSISYGIVREHGGQISFETHFGEWTRFHLDIPLDKHKIS